MCVSFEPDICVLKCEIGQPPTPCMVPRTRMAQIFLRLLDIVGRNLEAAEASSASPAEDGNLVCVNRRAHNTVRSALWGHCALSHRPLPHRGCQAWGRAWGRVPRAQQSGTATWTGVAEGGCCDSKTTATSRRRRFLISHNPYRYVDSTEWNQSRVSHSPHLGSQMPRPPQVRSAD